MYLIYKSIEVNELNVGDRYLFRLPSDSIGVNDLHYVFDRHTLTLIDIDEESVYDDYNEEDNVIFNIRYKDFNNEECEDSLNHDDMVYVVVSEKTLPKNYKRTWKYDFELQQQQEEAEEYNGEVPF